MLYVFIHCFIILPFQFIFYIFLQFFSPSLSLSRFLLLYSTIDLVFECLLMCAPVCKWLSYRNARHGTAIFIFACHNWTLIEQTWFLICIEAEMLHFNCKPHTNTRTHAHCPYMHAVTCRLLQSKAVHTHTGLFIIFNQRRLRLVRFRIFRIFCSSGKYSISNTQNNSMCTCNAYKTHTKTKTNISAHTYTQTNTFSCTQK